MSFLKFSGSAKFDIKVRPRDGGAAGTSPKSSRPRSRAALFLLAAMFAGFGGWWANAEYTILRTWPSTDGVVVSARIVTRRDRKQNILYAPEISFQYLAEGRRYVSADRSSAATSFKSWPEHVVDGNPVGAHRLLHYDPTDPSRIRFNQGYNFSTFGAPGIFIAIGLVLFVLLLRTYRSPVTIITAACPSCGAPIEFGRNTCPQCGAFLSTSPDAPTG